MKTILLFAGLLLIATGCSDDEANPSASPGSGGGGTGGTGGSGGTGGTSGGASGTAGTAGSGGNDASSGITISGYAHEWDQADPFAAPVLAGVKVCLHEHPEVACDTTGADGAWSLMGVPRNAEVAVTLEMSGRFSWIRAIKTGTTDIAMVPFENSMTPESAVGSFLPGVTIDPNGGGIVFFVTMPGTRFQGVFDWLPGYTVTLTPGGGGRGPLYLDETHTYDPSATAAAGGWGQYVNVASGTYTLAFSVPPGTTCTTWADQSYGYPTERQLEIRIPIVGGFTTGPVGFSCAPPAGDGGSDAGDAGTDAGDAGASDAGAG